MRWDERMRFNASAPPRPGLDAMAREIGGRTARVTAVRRLKGGVDASTHAVRIDPGGWVVLKRTWDTDGSSMRAEFARLEIAASIEVCTPSPLAIDLDRRWFDRPAFVMTKVDGRSRLHEDRGTWVTALAAALATIHAAPRPPRDHPAMQSRHVGLVWQPPDARRLRRTARVQRLIDVGLELQADLPPESEDVVLHHDFHQGNVTWTRHGLGGVVDWNELRFGPAASDVAYCSADLAMTCGIDAAEDFIAAYDASRGGIEDLRRWQALWIANDMRWVGYWLVGLQEAGTTASLAVLRRRLQRYGDYVLARL